MCAGTHLRYSKGLKTERCRATAPGSKTESIFFDDGSIQEWLIESSNDHSYVYLMDASVWRFTTTKRSVMAIKWASPMRRLRRRTVSDQLLRIQWTRRRRHVHATHRHLIKGLTHRAPGIADRRGMKTTLFARLKRKDHDIPGCIRCTTVGEQRATFRLRSIGRPH